MSDTLSPEQTRWVEQFVPRVAELAHRMSRRVRHLGEDELVSAGYEGLVQAALRYDPKSGVPFAAWAHYRVRGAMIDAGRRAAPEMRRNARAMRALEATQALFEHAQRKLVHRDVADPRSLRERVVVAAELVAQTTTAVILSRLAPEDPETLAATDPDMETQLANDEELRAVQRVLARCTPDERRLIEALYVQGLSMHDYAQEIGKSVSTVSRHHAKLVSRLSELLRGRAPMRADDSRAESAEGPPRGGARVAGLGPRGPPVARDS
jgi:RNA polymerase sigma factor for flagellar operon FliA